jgi:hypothetical protein
MAAAIDPQESPALTWYAMGQLGVVPNRQTPAPARRLEQSRVLPSAYCSSSTGMPAAAAMLSQVSPAATVYCWPVQDAEGAASKGPVRNNCQVVDLGCWV